MSVGFLRAHRHRPRGAGRSPENPPVPGGGGAVCARRPPSTPLELHSHRRGSGGRAEPGHRPRSGDALLWWPDCGRPLEADILPAQPPCKNCSNREVQRAGAGLLRRQPQHSDSDGADNSKWISFPLGQRGAALGLPALQPRKCH